MKNYKIPVLSAVLGSAITIVFFVALNLNQPKTVKVDHLTQIPSSGALYTMDQSGNAVPLDFTDVSKKVMDAVVHISSIQDVRQMRGGNNNYDQLPDPFREFFRQFEQQNPEFTATTRSTATKTWNRFGCNY